MAKTSFWFRVQFSCQDAKQAQKLFRALADTGVTYQSKVEEDWTGSDGDDCIDPLYHIFLSEVSANIEQLKQVAAQTDVQLSQLQETISSSSLYVE